MSHVLIEMRVIGGRTSMRDLLRWSEKGRSYRTIQRFYNSEVPWNAIQWSFFQKRILKQEGEYIMAVDEIVVSKAGKGAYGLERLFPGE